MGGKWRKGPPNFYSIKQVSKMVFFFFFFVAERCLFCGGNGDEKKFNK